MVIMDSFTPIEKYSSYKKRKFHEYKQKAERLLKGIDDLSLKYNDKLKLRDHLGCILSLPNEEATSVSENEQQENICGISGCKEPEYKAGYCREHYADYMRV